MIDQKTQSDITGSILLQLLHETERRARVLPSVELLKEIIRQGDGSFSGFLWTLDGYEPMLVSQEPSVDLTLPSVGGQDQSAQAALD